jgi:hypothetical protein
MKCDCDDAIIRYETGELTLDQAGGLDAHVANCDLCARSRATLRQALADLAAPEGGGPAFVDRVREAAKLTTVETPPAHARPWRWTIASALAAAAIAALVVWSFDRRGVLPMNETLQARGGASAQALPPAYGRVLLFRAGRLQPVPTQGLSRDDAFAVMATNRAGSPRFLLAFGLDAQGEVHWFYPEYRDRESPPDAVEIAPDPEDRVLGQLVAPEGVPSGPFRIATAIFPYPIRVTDVEVRLHGRDALSSIAPLFPEAAVREWASTWRDGQ